MKKLDKISIGDVLTFNLNNGFYRVFICTKREIERSPHYYIFSCLNYNSKRVPTVAEVLECDFFGAITRSTNYLPYSDAENEKIWSFYPNIRPNILGNYGILISRKDLMKFNDRIEKICNFKIIENLDLHGTGSMNASSWDYINEFFDEDYKKIFLERGQNLFKVKSIVY